MKRYLVMFVLSLAMSINALAEICTVDFGPHTASSYHNHFSLKGYAIAETPEQKTSATLGVKVLSGTQQYVGNDNFGNEVFDSSFSKIEIYQKSKLVWASGDIRPILRAKTIVLGLETLGCYPQKP